MRLSITLSLVVLGVVVFVEARPERKVLSNDDSLSAFHDFIKTFNKEYKTDHEFNKRYQIFTTNMKRAQELQKNQKGTATYGATIFADLTVEEFKKRQGLKSSTKPHSVRYPKAEIPDVVLPKNYDWRHYNVVTAVKDQGNCGSCWTFSTTGNIEGQYALKYSELLSFSEQELVDCDKLDSGCNGGYPFLAYQEIEDLGGLELESDYTYTGTDGDCSFDSSKVAVKLAGAVELPTDEDDIAKWLVQNGPVSIAINADDMQLYKGGISHPKSCDKYNLDHAVLIVGYGVKRVKSHKKWKKIPFWIIKNSWGTSWGEKGYYRVFRGAGICGLNLNPSSAVVA